MGAWGTDLISNDAVADLMIELDDSKNKYEFISVLAKKAELESIENQVSKDDLPLIYEPEEEASLLEELVSEDQETSCRTEFLGIVSYCLTEQSNILSKQNLEQALIFTKELSHKNLLNLWNNPGERLQSLLEFVKEVETELQKRS